MLRKQSLDILKRYYCMKKNKCIGSNQIRQNFIEFFINNHNHKFIRSSPVVPFSDPTVAFVNSGMNQFKSIFLGNKNPDSKRVANSQKCIRVGGKHNDLSIVGLDGYHHTFFEMLGNWSFGDYFKKEACEMALQLLKGPFGIEQNRLYFTYFRGDLDLQLPPDMETYEIWRELGISEDRILPFGIKDNFWEMGQTGPCGPCTEIHIDNGTSFKVNRSEFVNAGKSDLTELWNIVFIQYNRNNDGSIDQLPQKHVDTGMGFERLVALLQNKPSNYDTDLFIPIFKRIEKVAKCSPYTGLNFDNKDIDTGYRVIADHARMVTACLSDGMLPDHSHKLRRVLRTAILVSEGMFKKENLLNEIIPIVVELLGPTYPEMYHKLNDTLDIISHEQEVFKALRISCAKECNELLLKHNYYDQIGIIDSPGFVSAYKELLQQKQYFIANKIPDEFIYKLYDTYGLNNEAINSLANLENLNFNAIEKNKFRTKDNSKHNLSNNIHKNALNIANAKLTSKCQNTNNQYKYNYEYNNIKKQYEVNEVKAKIIGIIHKNKEITDNIIINTNDIYCIITDKSNFFYESGGQQGDIGTILVSANGEFVHFNVKEIQHINDNVIHIGTFYSSNFKLNVGQSCKLLVDAIHRSQNTYNHTATHLLNAVIRKLFKRVTYQVSSIVTNEHLKFELGIIGKKITREDINLIEQYIRHIIQANTPVTVSEIDSDKVFTDSSITLVPGEIYPENGLRLLTINNDKLDFLSKELCCGTHVDNTIHLKNFCITNFKQTGRARYAFTAITSDMAEKTLNLANSYSTGIDKLENDLQLEQDKHLLVDAELQKLRNTFLHTHILLPYVFKMDAIDRVNSLLKKLKESSRTTLNEFVEIEMQNILQQNPKSPYIIHFLDSSTLLESVPLQKATRLCPDRPIMVISLNDRMIKARCCVPYVKVSKKFSAIKWLNSFATIFKADIGPPKGQDPKLVCNMKAKKINASIFDEQLETAMNIAAKLANDKCD